MTDPISPTVFVIDDDHAVCAALKILLESAGLQVETFTSALSFLDRATDATAGCVLLDVRMPGMDGLELQRQLRDREINLPIIIVTGHGDIPMAVRALRAGALNFIEKPFEDHTLLNAVHEALSRDEQTRAVALQREEVRARVDRLTPREYEVMRRVIAGRSTKEIAAEFDVSNQAIDAHRKHVLQKMNVSSIAALVRITLLVGIEPVEQET